MREGGKLKGTEESKDGRKEGQRSTAQAEGGRDSGIEGKEGRKEEKGIMYTQSRDTSSSSPFQGFRVDGMCVHVRVSTSLVYVCGGQISVRLFVCMYVLYIICICACVPVCVCTCVRV